MSGRVGKRWSLAEQRRHAEGASRRLHHSVRKWIRYHARRRAPAIRSRYIRGRLTESEARTRRDVVQVREAPASAKHSSRRQLESCADARLHVVPVGIVRRGRQPVLPGESDSAVDFISRERVLVDPGRDRIYGIREKFTVDPVILLGDRKQNVPSKPEVER